MALTFPDGPFLNQVYSAEGSDFVWVGDAWVLLDFDTFPWADDNSAVGREDAARAITPASLKAVIATVPSGSGNPVGGVPVNQVANRARNTNYVNSTGNPLLVHISAQLPTAGEAQLRVAALASDLATSIVDRTATGFASLRVSFFAVVPAGWRYRFNSPADAVLEQWMEYA